MEIELPNGTVLDAPDGLSAGQIKGIVQKFTGAKPAAPAPAPAPSGTSNVPVGLQTGDPATDKQIAANLARQGYDKALTPGDALHAGAIAGSLLLPEVLGPISGAITGGGLFGAGTSGGNTAGEVAKDAAKGAGAALAGYGVLRGVGAGLGRIAGVASRKAGEALGEAAAKANAEATGALRSETGTLGGFRQDLNRKVENASRLSAEPNLDPNLRAQLDTARNSPDFADVVNKAAQSTLDTLPGAVSRTTAQEAKVAQMTADLPQAVASRAEQLSGGKEAWNQIKARVIRYGLPSVGALLGHALLPEMPQLGIGGGALAGAGLRPMMQSLLRLRSNPAVRTQLWGALEGLANLGAKPAAALTPLGARLGVAATTLGATTDSTRPPISLPFPALAARSEERDPSEFRTGTGSAGAGGSQPGLPTPSWHEATPLSGAGPVPSSQDITPGAHVTGAGMDGASHFERFMTDEAYRRHMRERESGE